MHKDASGSQQPQQRIDYAELPSRDLKATKLFYNTVFGWQFKDHGPEYSSFTAGRLAGGFTTEIPSPGYGVVMVIHTEDLENALGKVKAAGGAIVKGIFDFPGGRNFHFKDPSGNEVAVWTNTTAAD
jgi:predicted enzyme related to lactoylglutathione lyase